jgi:hypothetical protein
MAVRGGGCRKRGLKATDRGGCRHGLLEAGNKLSLSRCSELLINLIGEDKKAASTLPRAG